MPTTHVFIVDTRTFKYHLEYMFAGTGAKDVRPDFIGQETTLMHHSQEDNAMRLIADAQRVRAGDFAIFYLQQDFQKGVTEGKFYGIFKVKQDLSFFDNLD